MSRTTPVWLQRRLWLQPWLGPSARPRSRALPRGWKERRTPWLRVREWAHAAAKPPNSNCARRAKWRCVHHHAGAEAFGFNDRTLVRQVFTDLRMDRAAAKEVLDAVARKSFLQARRAGGVQTAAMGAACPSKPWRCH